MDTMIFIIISYVSNELTLFKNLIPLRIFRTCFYVRTFVVIV